MKRRILFPLLLFVFPVIVSAQSTAKEWYNKGIELKGKQDHEGALAAFKNAISKKADYNEAYYQAGGCCNELEKYEDEENQPEDLEDESYDINDDDE